MIEEFGASNCFTKIVSLKMPILGFFPWSLKGYSMWFFFDACRVDVLKYGEKGLEILRIQSTSPGL